MKKIRIGQIGIGHNHGEAKMLAVRKRPDLFEIVGYAEESEEWIEKRGSFPGYEGLKRMSVEELIASCDAILVESDVWDLTKYATMCIEAGKHIHMDKPASGTIEEYKYMLDLAKEKGLTVQLGYMYRNNPAVVKTIEAVKSGKLGEIYSINAEMSTNHTPWYKSWLSNFNGGIMYILGSHLVDLVVYMLGRPNKITSFMKHTGKDGVDLPDNNLAVLEYDKALVRIFVSSVEVNGWGRRQLVVSGSKGTISILPLENECHMTYSDTEIATHEYKDMKTVIDVEDLPPDCRYDGMMESFAACIRGEETNPFTYEHDLIVQEVLSEIVGGVRFGSRKTISGQPGQNP